MEEGLLGKSFGRAVRSKRIALGITQEKLAELADLHPTYISMVERAVRSPTLEVCNKLANALEIELSALISEATALAKKGQD